MKFPSTIFTAFILITSIVRAESLFERDLIAAREQHDKAIASAIDPINRRYQTTLEQLLRKATQANDLDAALKIQNELKSTRPVASPIDLRTTLEGTEWTWERPGVSEWVKFNKDGTLLHKIGWTGTWKIAGPRSVTITTPNNTTSVLEFNENATAYKAISGKHEKDGLTGKKK